MTDTEKELREQMLKLGLWALAEDNGGWRLNCTVPSAAGTPMLDKTKVVFQDRDGWRAEWYDSSQLKVSYLYGDYETACRSYIAHASGIAPVNATVDAPLLAEQAARAETLEALRSEETAHAETRKELDLLREHRRQKDAWEIEILKKYGALLDEIEGRNRGRERRLQALYDAGFDVVDPRYCDTPTAIRILSTSGRRRGRRRNGTPTAWHASNSAPRVSRPPRPRSSRPASGWSLAGSKKATRAWW